LREECGIEPIISTHAIKIPSNGYTYMRHNDIEWSKVGLCINQTNLFNLFGGGWLKREVDQLKSWTNEYKGLTYVAYTDPAILWTNPFKLIVEKGRDKCHNCLDLEVDASYVQKFESQNIESLFIGRDYDLFRSMCKDGDRVIWPMINHEFDLVPYIIENEWNIQNSKLKTADLLSITNKETKDISKIHDIVYFGSNRPARGKVLRSLFKKNTSLNKKWIGYNPNFDAETTTTTEPVPRGELKQHLDGCKVSFVFEQGLVSFRFSIQLYTIYYSCVFILKFQHVLSLSLSSSLSTTTTTTTRTMSTRATCPFKGNIVLLLGKGEIVVVVIVIIVALNRRHHRYHLSYLCRSPLMSIFASSLYRFLFSKLSAAVFFHPPLHFF